MSTTVAVDMVLFALTPDADAVRFMAVRRREEPFQGKWSLPGRLIGEREDLDAAATASLADQTGVTQARHIEQLATFGGTTRDPRGRVISVSYLGLLPRVTPPADGAAWLDPTAKSQPLAFDHCAILTAGLARLRSKLGYSNIAYGLLPNEFTMADLQSVYEVVLGSELDKRNFRKKVIGLGILRETDHVRRGPHRPAQLFSFRQSGLVTIDAATIA